MATGTEVSLAVEAAEQLVKAVGGSVRIVSMPCERLFDETSADYKYVPWEFSEPCCTNVVSLGEVFSQKGCPLLQLRPRQLEDGSVMRTILWACTHSESPAKGR